jgi:hypothetical protein
LPAALIFEPALYGAGAILIRELARRRGLGWGNIFVLGLAYGVFEEALYTQTWFLPASKTFHDTFGRVWAVNTAWAVGLTLFHATMSVCVPIALAEAALPLRADRPWLGKNGRRALIGWFALTSLFATLGNAFVVNTSNAYPHPPLPQYLLAIGLTVAIYHLGLHIPFPTPASTARSAPRLWTVRLASVCVSALVFAWLYLLPVLVPVAAVEVALMVLTAILATLRVRSWARRAGWGPQHRLALASGALGFWIIVAPAAVATGLPFVALVALGWLIFLARRVARYLPNQPGAR